MKRIEWLDTSRVIAMLLVLIGHCSYYTINSDFGGIDYAVDTQSYFAVTVNVIRQNFILFGLFCHRRVLEFISFTHF